MATYTDPTSGAVFYDLKHRDQSSWRFRASDGLLDSMTDAYGHRLQLTWTATAVTIVDLASGRSLSVTFSAAPAQGGRATQVVTSPVTVGGSQQQLKWTYSYDGNGQLSSACDPAGNCTGYTNAGPGNRLTAITRPNGNGLSTLTYDASSRVKTRTDGMNNTTTFAYGPAGTGSPAGTAETTTVTDALNHVTQSSYNSLNQLLQHVNEDGTARTFTFDQHGFLNSIKDENGNTTSYLNDGAGNVLQTTDGAGDVSYSGYDAKNHLTTYRDPRSSSATDNTYLTTYTYDPTGNLFSEQTPAGTQSWTYSAGTEAAIGGGVVPPNLVLTATDAMNHMTAYGYDALGNLRHRVDPSGLTTDFTYDELGRETTQKQTSDTYPGGVVTTASYDAAGRLATLTEPATTNAVTGATHQRSTTMAYDKNGNLLSSTVSDLTGSDPSRKTTYGYDADDRQTSVTDALNHTSTTTYDAAAHVVQQKDAVGRVTQTTYTVTNLPATVKLLGFVDDPINPGTPRDVTLDTYTYDPGGREKTITDALGRVRRLDYDAANRLTRVTLLGYHNRDGSTRDIVLETRAYDSAGNLIDRVEAGIRDNAYTYNPAGRLTSSAVSSVFCDPLFGCVLSDTHTTGYTYDANGNMLSQTLSAQGFGIARPQILYGYDMDQAQRLNRVEVVDQNSPGAPNADQITTFGYDERGLRTSMTEPRGNYGGANPATFTTNYTYDQSGRRTATIAPAVQVELAARVCRARRWRRWARRPPPETDRRR
jgi:YD repeat-containing protein